MSNLLHVLPELTAKLQHLLFLLFVMHLQFSLRLLPDLIVPFVFARLGAILLILVLVVVILIVLILRIMAEHLHDMGEELCLGISLRSCLSCHIILLCLNKYCL